MHLSNKVRPYNFREDSEERRCRPAWHLARSVEGCPPPLAISSLGAAVVCACLVVRWSPHDCLGLEYCDGEPAKAGDVCVDGEDLFHLSPLSGLQPKDVNRRFWSWNCTWTGGAPDKCRVFVQSLFLHSYKPISINTCIYSYL